jgi:hypothetical protein
MFQRWNLFLAKSRSIESAVWESALSWCELCLSVKSLSFFGRKFWCLNFPVLQTRMLGWLYWKDEFVSGNILKPQSQISQPLDSGLYFISTFVHIFGFGDFSVFCWRILVICSWGHTERSNLVINLWFFFSIKSDSSYNPLARSSYFSSRRSIDFLHLVIELTISSGVCQYFHVLMVCTVRYT